MKMGKGGYGLQACDDEGKYVEVSISIGRRKVGNFSDYLDAISSSNPKIKDALASDKSETLRQRIFELYKSEFQKAIDDINDSDIVRCDTFEDFERNIDKIVTPRFVGIFKEYCPNGSLSDRFYDYVAGLGERKGIPKYVAALFSARYNGNTFRLTNDEEIKEKRDSGDIDAYFDGQKFGNWNISGSETTDYLQSMPEGKGLPIFRTLHDLKDPEKTMLGYVKKGYSKCNLSGKGGAGYGIYMSFMETRDTNIDGGYAKEGRKGNMVMHGYVPDIGKCKWGFAPNWSDYGNRKAAPMIDFKKGLEESIKRHNDGDTGDLIGKISSIFEKNGYGDFGECESFVGNVLARACDDNGMTGVLMGYDFLTGYSGECLVLNPRAFRISRNWEMT